MKLLIVEDNLRQRQLLQELFDRKDLFVTVCEDAAEALLLLENETFDTVITDLMMPNASGTDILKACQHQDRELPVIIITGFGSVDSAIEAMKIGAYDYIEKPFDPEELALVVDKALQHFALVKKNLDMAATIVTLQSNDFIGSSPSIKRIKAMIERVAPLDVPVLIQGETGTGKELVAGMIHRASKRSKQKLLAINCGALNESLLESELFGHQKGAFTGASNEKPGLFEVADKGTLFFDEVNSMSASLQAKVLRVIQDGSFLRVGGTTDIQTDVRVISAANADLKEVVNKKLFREDLYYRLNVMNIDLPPLREHPEDIAELAYSFLKKCNIKFEKKIDTIASQTLTYLTNYSWPGNVRELENTISRSVILEQDHVLTPATLTDDIVLDRHKKVLGKNLPLMRLEEMEQLMIKMALNQSNGNKSQAAQLLGIDTSTLWRKLKKIRSAG